MSSGWKLSPDELHPEELHVLSLIEDGLTNRQIADRLTLSMSRVRTIVYSIRCKCPHVDGGTRLQTKRELYQRAQHRKALKSFPYSRYLNETVDAIKGIKPDEEEDERVWTVDLNDCSATPPLRLGPGHVVTLGLPGDTGPPFPPWVNMPEEEEER